MQIYLQQWCRSSPAAHACPFRGKGSTPLRLRLGGNRSRKNAELKRLYVRLNRSKAQQDANDDVQKTENVSRLFG